MRQLDADRCNLRATDFKRMFGTKLVGIGSLALKFGKERIAFKPTHVKLPGGMKPLYTTPHDRPDDDPCPK